MRLIGLAVIFVLAPFVARAQQQGGKAHRHYIRIVRSGFRRLVALGVIISMTLTGCASGPYYVVPDLRDRATQIQSIAVVPVDVRVFRAVLLDEEFSDEWSKTARTNLRNAMAKYFGGDPRFAVKEFDPKGAETAQQELGWVRNVMEDMRPASGGACLPGPACACLLGPAPALADAAGTDTLLLAYGRDRITPAGVRAVIVIGLVLALPLIFLLLFLGSKPPGIRGSTDPSTVVQNPQTSGVAGGLRLAGFNAITLCLVDARAGDTLWFDLEAIGTGDLRDASDVERLIRGAYAKFKKAMHQ